MKDISEIHYTDLNRVIATIGAWEFALNEYFLHIMFLKTAFWFQSIICVRN